MASKRKMYKVLDANLQSCHGGKFDYTPYVGTGLLLPVIKRVSLCTKGYHFTTDPTQWLVVGARVFEVLQCGEPVDFSGDKGVFSTGVIGKECHDLIPGWWKEVEEFIVSIKNIDATKTFAREAAREDALCAAWWDAREAARNAGRDAALDAAREAAWNAAWNAAREAAREDALCAAWWDVRDAAREAALDAALYVACITVSDAIDAKHLESARLNWERWTKNEGDKS